MEGLFISRANEAVSKVSQPSYELSMLAAGNNLEIIQYEISVDMPCNICPGDNPDLMEFYYVLEGTAVLKLEGGDVTLGQGEFFYVQNLKEIINFTTHNGAKLLCVTSQPVFSYLRDYHEELGKLLEGAEAKDPYTYNHGNRVQAYCMKIGEKLGLANNELYTLQVASLFHDVGKYFMPDRILKKPKKLTAKEYERIKRHSTDSMELLKGKFEERILMAVAQHHERLDGSGYPKGLKGEEIITEAKIIAVADAYDAMTSNRVYRKAKTREGALMELESLREQFDGKVVGALRNVLEEEAAANYGEMIGISATV